MPPWNPIAMLNLPKPHCVIHGSTASSACIPRISPEICNCDIAVDALKAGVKLMANICLCYKKIKASDKDSPEFTWKYYFGAK